MFKVPVTVIDAIEPHPNADKLEFAVIKGWRSIVQKDQFNEGDRVVYFPEDSLIPEDILEELGLKGYLAGPDNNRVKTIRLRGEYSQGVVAPLSILEGRLDEPFNVGDNMKEVLGVEKWEMPVPIQMRGKQLKRPYWLPRYPGIENYRNYPNIFEEGERVVMTEKIHGTSVHYGFNGEEFRVSGRNVVLAEDEANLYWRVALQEGIEDKLRELYKASDESTVIIYGEIFGHKVQDMWYGKDKDELDLRLYDVMLGGRFLNYNEFILAAGVLELETVPVLYKGSFHEQELDLHTNGTTTLGGDHTREGLVVRPVEERWDEELGRVILKSKSPEYLSRDEGTEYH